MIFYHGARRWDPPPRIPEARSQKDAEYGPGLYLTSGMGTARKYAKGGGIVLRFEIDPNLSLLDNAHISAAEMRRFLHDIPRLRKRSAIEADIAKVVRRVDKDVISAATLVNLMRTQGVAYGAPGAALVQFYQAHGIDADVVTGQGLAGDEHWLILYNLDKIRGYERVLPTDNSHVKRLDRDQGRAGD
jgi:hypothetical protein